MNTSPSILTRAALSSLLVLSSPCLLAADVTGALVQTIITKSPPWTRISPSGIAYTSPDPSGITYLSSTGRLLDCDGEVDEMPAFFTGDNLFEINLDGTLGPTHSTTNLSRTGYSNEPVGCAYNSATGDLFISDDDQRKVFQIRPGTDNLLFTADDIRTEFRAPDVCGISDIDAEGLAYGAGKLFIIDGVGAEVWQVTPSADGIFDGVGETCTHFDTSVWALDPEGGEYDTDNPGHIFVVGKPASRVVSFTTAGTQAGTIDISSASAKKPAGLAAAPWSGVNSDSTPECKNLYIVDRGVDNDSNSSENDGKLYELSIPCSTSGNQAPTVNAGLDQPAVNFSAACGSTSIPTPCTNIDGTETDDALPNPPATVTTTWSKVSGPGTVTFGNANVIDTTAAFSSAGSYALRLTANDSVLSTSDVVNIAIQPPPSDFTKVYVSTVDNGTTANGVAFRDEDILVYEAGTWSLYFDGSDVGLGGSSVDIDAFNIRPDGSILLSLATDGVSIPGLGAIDDSDIVRFIPSSIGSNTAGTYEWYSDGSDVGLAANADDVDAIGFTPDGKLVVSTIDPPSVVLNPSVPGYTAADEDLLVFTPLTNGTSPACTSATGGLGLETCGTWAPYFDGSDVGLADSSSEDTNGVFIDSNADIHLTTVGNFTVTNISGAGDDIFKCTPSSSSTGDATSCNYDSIPTFDGVGNGLPTGAVLDGIALVRTVSGNTAPVLATIGNKSVNAGSLLSFTATATDANAGDTLSFSLINSPPAGASITPAGAFSWTPSTAGSYPITVQVCDNAAPPLCDTETITVTVNAVSGGNTAPVLTTIGNKAVNVGNLLSFTATATDANAGDTLSFSLINSPPAGASITPAGAFSWTPSTTGSYPITVQVCDNAAPPLCDTETITVTVSAAGGGSTITINVGVSNGSDDAEEVVATGGGAVGLTSSDLEMIHDGSSQQIVGLRFNLVNIPQGATIISASIQYTAKDSNQTEATSLTIKGQAVDNAPTFTTTSGNISSRPTTTASVSWPVSGWVTAEDALLAQKTPELQTVIQEIVNRSVWAANNSLAVIISGTGLRNAWSFNGKSVAAPRLQVEYATSGNTAPVLATIGNKSVNAGSPLSFTATATDANAGDTLSFSLINNPPSGASITPAGTFSWTPSTTGSYPITVQVCDNAVPPLCDTETITVTVNAVSGGNSAPVLTTIGNKSVNAGSLLSFTATATDANAGDTLSFSLINNPPSGTSITTAGAFSWTPSTAGSYPITVQVCDNAATPLCDTETITVTVNLVGGVTILESRVSGSTDDAEEYVSSGSVDLKSSDLEMTQESGGAQTVGLRFNNLTIPQGATITNAYIQFTVDEVHPDVTSLTIQGEDVDNASTFTTASGNISSRPKTDASVPWNPAEWSTTNVAQMTQDIKDVIQEIVNRSPIGTDTGWVSGNSLAVIITGTGKRVAIAYNGVAASAPLLHVEYTN